MYPENVTEAEIAAQAADMGLPLKPEDVASLLVGVRRNMEMAAANRELIADAMAPVLFPAPARRPSRGS